MSFRDEERSGTIYAPGWFLADNEGCTRLTHEADATDNRAVTAGGGKYIPMGTIYPTNDDDAIGIIYEDVDVSGGNMPCSVVTRGVVYEDRLPEDLDSDAKTALEGLGFVFIESSGAVVRPDDGRGELDELTVTSAAGTASGDTKITVTGHSLASGESYVYKTDSTKAPVIKYKAIPDYTWAAWDGEDDIAATTGHYITIAVVNAENRVVAAGNATVTAKA